MKSIHLVIYFALLLFFNIFALVGVFGYIPHYLWIICFGGAVASLCGLGIGILLKIG